MLSPILLAAAQHVALHCLPCNCMALHVSSSNLDHFQMFFQYTTVVSVHNKNIHY